MTALVKVSALWRRLRDDLRGSLTLEFAFVAPVLIVSFIGIGEIGRLFWTRHALEYAIQETARTAMINKTATSQALTEMVAQRIGWVDSEDLSIVVQFTNASGKDYATVTATYRFTLLLGFLGIAPFDISTSAHVPRPP